MDGGGGYIWLAAKINENHINKKLAVGYWDTLTVKNCMLHKERINSAKNCENLINW